jgi:hypothetical protein
MCYSVKVVGLAKRVLLQIPYARLLIFNKRNRTQ